MVYQIRGPRGRPRQRKQSLAKLMAKDSGQKQQKRILLVDDDAEIIESLRLALESHGYTVLVARDGNQGLALTERENPDLVILDMMMPKRSGFLVLEKLRRTPRDAAPRDHDHGQRRQPPQGLRRNARRRRLHPQAVPDGPADRKRQAAGRVGHLLGCLFFERTRR